jgi:hypothetical protein
MLHNMKPSDFKTHFDEIKELIRLLSTNKEKASQEQYLTRREVSEMLKCDISTVHSWIKRKILKAYGIGNRVYYKLSEIEAAMMPLNNV